MSKEVVVIGKPGMHFQSASLARITCRNFSSRNGQCFKLMVMYAYLKSPDKFLL